MPFEVIEVAAKSVDHECSSDRGALRVFTFGHDHEEMGFYMSTSESSTRNAIDIELK